MESTELAFYTTKELIDELMRRRTFCGCVIQATEDHKEADWCERTFRVHYNKNLTRGSVSRLLCKVAEYLDLNLT